MIGATDSSLNACRRFTRKPEPILLISVEKPTCVREYALDCGAVGSVADRARHPRLTIYRLRISGGMAIAYEKSQKSASARRVTPEAMWRRTLHLIGHSRPESRKFPRSPRAVSEAPPARKRGSHWSAWALSIQRLEGSPWLWDLNGAE